MTTFKTKTIVMAPKPKRKWGVAKQQEKVFANPDVGRAMAEDQFYDQGGKQVRVRHQKFWARTRF